MFFRTRYGTKASIRAEPLALHHIESYTPNLINMNYTILAIDENDTANEPTTSLAKMPDFLLDEWANAYHFDPKKPWRHALLLIVYQRKILLFLT